jgi:hypothetical protein
MLTSGRAALECRAVDQLHLPPRSISTVADRNDLRATVTTVKQVDARDQDGGARGRRFVATVSDGGRGRIFVAVPFDADAVWGPKPRHPVGGTLNGTRVRGVVQPHDGVQGLLVGPSWLRGCDLSPGDQAKVYLEPEGPQRQDLADDIAAALQANPRAAQFFDGLAQFYRRGYLRWIDATKRSPELRQERITTMVQLLEAGIKDYHNQ